MLSLTFKQYNLRFINPVTTSRGTMIEKPSWFFELTDSNLSERKFHGECSVIPDLSIDNLKLIESKMNDNCFLVNKNQTLEINTDNIIFPSVDFGFEMLLADYHSKNEKVLFENDFTDGYIGIPINGLIWMGDKRKMYGQIKSKLDRGWKCIKIKVGGIKFEDEIDILKYIRHNFDENELELRLDANGAFASVDALNKLEILSQFDIHSIEQPIRQGNIEEMAKLCQSSPIPIALDEELIGIFDKEKKIELLKSINPDYIIIKPSLLGGWKKSDEWIDIATEINIGYWITSALESNIGLNAIAQWTASKSDSNKVHGLGTGMLYENNFKSPLKIIHDKLFFDPEEKFQIQF